MANPATSLLLKGIQSADVPSPNYNRLRNYGPLTNFVEFWKASDPTMGSFPANQPATFLVDISFPLHFSGADAQLKPDYPLQEPAVPLGPRPIVPIHPPGGPQLPPPPLGFFGSDGSPLNPTVVGNQVIRLQGTSKAGDKFDLHLSTRVLAQEHGVINLPTWVFANISITKNGDTPLVFGISYNPLYKQFGVGLSRGTIQTILTTGIGVDMRPLAVNSAGTLSGTANLMRGVTFQGESYSAQTLPMSPDSLDPQMYLPTFATLWPFLDRIQYFAPALDQLGKDQLPAMATPLMALGSVQFDKWPVTLQQVLTSTTALVGPAFGPMAAEFLAFTEWPVDGLRAAAKWLGWTLVQGSGSHNLQTVITNYYNYYAGLAANGGLGRAVGGGAPIDEWRDLFGYLDKIASFAPGESHPAKEKAVVGTA
jgi:hypothetical protein